MNDASSEREHHLSVSVPYLTGQLAARGIDAMPMMHDGDRVLLIGSTYLNLENLADGLTRALPEERAHVLDHWLAFAIECYERLESTEPPDADEIVNVCARAYWLPLMPRTATMRGG